MSQPREGFFETNPAMFIVPSSVLTGTLNAIAKGDTAIVGTGTLFTSELSVDDIITFVDTAGERQFYTVKTITDDLNLTLSQAARTASAITTSFTTGAPRSNYFIVRDNQNLTYPLGDPVLGRIGSGLSGGYRMNAPSINGIVFTDSININEGITIKTIYIRNPYQHTWGDRSFQVSMYQVDDGGGGETLIQELGVNGFFFIPNENTEIDVNIYIPPLTTATSGWGLSALISNSKTDQNESLSETVDSIEARVSNVSVPSEMDGLLLPLVIGCRFTYGFNITG